MVKTGRKPKVWKRKEVILEINDLRHSDNKYEVSDTRISESEL